MSWALLNPYFADVVIKGTKQLNYLPRLSEIAKIWTLVMRQHGGSQELTPMLRVSSWVFERMNERRKPASLRTEERKGKCCMTLWNPSAEFIKEKHKDSRRPGRDGDYGGSAGHRVQGEFKVSGKSDCPGNCRENSEKLQVTVNQIRPAPGVKTSPALTFMACLLYTQSYAGAMHTCWLTEWKLSPPSKALIHQVFTVHLLNAKVLT